MVNNLLFMKRLILSFFFLVTIVSLSWCQEAKKIQVDDTKIVKLQSNKTTYSNHDFDQKSTEKDQPIILRLSSNERATSNVKTENEIDSTTDQSDKIDELIKAKESLISAIDKKVDDVKSSDEEFKKAQELGWFDQMEASKKSALADIEKLKSLKNK